MDRGIFYMEERMAGKAHRPDGGRRRTGTVTGVVDVLSFDLTEILLETDQGMLMIRGQ